MNALKTQLLHHQNNEFTKFRWVKTTRRVVTACNKINTFHQRGNNRWLHRTLLTESQILVHLMSYQFDVCELLGEDEGVLTHAHHIASLTRGLFALQGSGPLHRHRVKRSYSLLVLAESREAFDQPLGHLLHGSPRVLETWHTHRTSRKSCS